MLDRGYPLLDIMVQLLGLPASVYAAMTGTSRPGTRFPYDTEDTAGAICRYSDGCVAVLCASWSTGPAGWSIDLHGVGGSLAMDSRGLCALDRLGAPRGERIESAANPLQQQIDDFALKCTLAISTCLTSERKRRIRKLRAPPTCCRSVLCGRLFAGHA
jgi:predicted dehydrogenase